MSIKNLAVKILISYKIDSSRGAQDDKEKWVWDDKKFLDNPINTTTKYLIN